jgi:hypothetical protein
MRFRGAFALRVAVEPWPVAKAAIPSLFHQPSSKSFLGRVPLLSRVSYPHRSFFVSDTASAYVREDG